MIRFENVTKEYPDGTVAVDGLDLTAPTGKLTVFVGPSGCGKTTSLRMINRMIEPTSGTITVDGTDTSTMQTHVLRRKIGYVIQHAGLFPHRTIIDNVITVPLLLGDDKKKARDRGMELLERVGLDPNFAKRYPAQLSGGQQQRVAIARAIVTNPVLLLADEPTGALDSVTGHELLDFLRRSVRELGQTVVMVTHDPSAATYADRVLVLADGRIAGELREPTADDVLGALRGLGA